MVSGHLMLARLYQAHIISHRPHDVWFMLCLSNPSRSLGLYSKRITASWRYLSHMPRFFANFFLMDKAIDFEGFMSHSDWPIKCYSLRWMRTYLKVWGKHSGKWDASIALSPEWWYDTCSARTIAEYILTTRFEPNKIVDRDDKSSRTTLWWYLCRDWTQIFWSIEAYSIQAQT